MITHRIAINICLGISLLIASYSCDQQKQIVVEPISKEFNDDYLTGNGLDANYFSTRDVMQYYQVSNYSGLNAYQMLVNLHAFSMASFPPEKLTHIKKLTLLFYKKKLFVDYRDHLYESARDNDSRRLFDYNDDLLAIISFERIKDDLQKMSLKKILYDNAELRMKLMDTISVK